MSTGDVAPAEQNLTLARDDLLDDLLDLGARRRVARHEKLTDRVMARRSGSVMPSLAHSGAKNPCGICVSTPQPSPSLASAPVAPR